MPSLGQDVMQNGWGEERTHEVGGKAGLGIAPVRHGEGRRAWFLSPFLSSSVVGAHPIARTRTPGGSPADGSGPGARRRRLKPFGGVPGPSPGKGGGCYFPAAPVVFPPMISWWISA
ncbi:hypothetical protein SSCG_02766 [Streptomyces clavuligerus]|nr:hypothetical protein SSCG_02766 [Streptomyces clavuligerus]